MRRFLLVSVFAAGLSVSAQAANLVTNGSFETGDFTGWSTSGDMSGSAVVVDATNATDGTHVASLGGTSDIYGFISQTITTVAGTAYILSFTLAQTGFSFNDYAMIWDGVGVLADGAIPPFPVTSYSFTVIGTGSDTLDFRFYNKHGVFLLDNVQVNEAVPEPATLALLGVGLAGLGFARRRRTA